MLNLTVGYLCAKCILAMLFTFAENIFYEKSEPRCSHDSASDAPALILGVNHHVVRDFIGL